MNGAVPTNVCSACGTPWTAPDWRCEDHKAAETTLPPMDKDMVDGLRQAGRKVQEWTTERDSRIRAAVAAGGSLREVGDAVGLSHTAVKFIAHGRG